MPTPTECTKLRFRQRHKLNGTQTKPGNMSVVDCLQCRKRGYRSEEAARWVIGYMLRSGSFDDDVETFAFQPYRCSLGWWHLGHNPRTKWLFRELERQSGIEQTEKMSTPRLTSLAKAGKRASQLHTRAVRGAHRAQEAQAT